MILRDVLNRFDNDTEIKLFDDDGVLIKYTFADVHEEKYDYCEVIFPMSVKNNKVEIWIEAR